MIVDSKYTSKSMVDAGFSSKKIAIMLSTILFVFGIDRISKIVAQASLIHGAHVDFLPFVSLRLVYNTGAAWGIFSDATFILGIVALAEAILIFLFTFMFHRFFDRTISYKELVALSAIIAGGLGNAYDRFFYGKVVDFLNLTFIEFPIFNIADMGVTLGLLAFLLFVRHQSRVIKNTKE